MTAFINARLAHSGEHRATNLMVVDSSPTMSKNFSFLSLSTCSCEVGWPHTNEIKHDIHPR